MAQNLGLSAVPAKERPAVGGLAAGTFLFRLEGGEQDAGDQDRVDPAVLGLKLDEIAADRLHAPRDSVPSVVFR
jgi:hypothetical protein